MSSATVTAGEIMDRSAVLMNDPLKTDYTYAALAPFLAMALDELTEALVESQQAPVVSVSDIVTIPIGASAMYPADSLNTPHYSIELSEVQEIGERLAGSNDIFIPMRRVEYIDMLPAADRLGVWAWDSQTIKFNPSGATTAREVRLKYLRTYAGTPGPTITPESSVGPINSRSFLSYKTAAYAAQFIGENQERAMILDAKAEQALERIHSINNKGRQQIMTRHRPFRAAFKARGGF